MLATDAFVSTSVAAYIAGLNDRQMNRVFDEHLVPDSLLRQDGPTRRFARLGSAFAAFYFETDQILQANARRQMVEELLLRVAKLDAPAELIALQRLPKGLNWKVAQPGIEIDLLPFIKRAFDRARQVDAANALVSTDLEVLNGTPCFAGTRVPIETVLASLGKGIHTDRLQGAYQFLTDRHIAAAQVYAQVHPRRGRPPRLIESNPHLLAKTGKVVRPARA
jgi:uncharacterized protein (DUF433 family)